MLKRTTTKTAGRVAALLLLMAGISVLSACGKDTEAEEASEVIEPAPIVNVADEPAEIEPDVTVDKVSKEPEEEPVEAETTTVSTSMPQQGGVTASTGGKNIIKLNGDKNTDKDTESKDSVSENTVSEDSASETGNKPQGKEIKMVYIDPGHGGDAAGPTEFDGTQYVRAAGGAAIAVFPENSLGTTTGASSGNITECDAVYQLALKVKSRLEKDGYIVVLSRDDVHTAAQGGGTAVGNWERGRKAAQYDCWIVLHIDSGAGQGMHCLSYNNDPTFSNDLCDEFIKDIESQGRKVYTASGYNHGYSGNGWGVLQGPQKYIEYGGNVNNIIYLEAGFMEDTDDRAFVLSEAGQNAIAESLTKALNSRKKGD